LVPAELWTFRVFGVGNREVEGASDDNRGCNEPAVRDVLPLAFGVTDKLELYLRLMSGVVREEEGVGTFRGSIDGDRDEFRGVKVGKGASG
jgi:hypothetical protein